MEMEVKILQEKAEENRRVVNSHYQEFKALELEVSAMRASKEVVDLTEEEAEDKENEFVLGSPFVFTPVAMKTLEEIVEGSAEQLIRSWAEQDREKSPVV